MVVDQAASLATNTTLSSVKLDSPEGGNPAAAALSSALRCNTRLTTVELASVNCANTNTGIHTNANANANASSNTNNTSNDNNNKNNNSNNNKNVVGFVFVREQVVNVD